MTYQFELERRFDAEPAEVWDAMLDPRAQLQWWGGPGELVRATCDLRVGGVATIEWGSSETSMIRADQVFVAIDRPASLVYKETVREARHPSYECLLTFRLEPEGKKTRVALVHAGFPTTAERDLHQQGTNIFFDRLTRYAESQTRARG